MVDYGASLRYASDRRGFDIPSGAKRIRLDYEDILASRIYDDRSWGGRESDPLPGGGDIRSALPFGVGLSSDFSLGGRQSLLGLSGAGGLGNISGGPGRLDDASFIGQRTHMFDTDAGFGGRPGALPVNGAARESDILPADAADTLFVEGLPADCTHREVAHIFRAFVGFKEVRVIRKEIAKGSNEKAVLCFVEFTDPKCAARALDALQGYKLDEKDHDSPVLNLAFSRNPRGSSRDDRRGRFRDDDHRALRH